MVLAFHKNPSELNRQMGCSNFEYFILRDFPLFRKCVIQIIVIKVIHAAVVHTEERARALSEADQGNMSPRTQADAEGRVQLAESEIRLRSTSTRMGEGKRSGSKSRSAISGSSSSGSNEKNGMVAASHCL